MDLPPLPVTVVSGYLGSGKTSLVNHMLRNAGGRRIMVLVNDFGDLDIDAALLESASGDTLTLANGCICCTMGTELLYALSDALDRRPRPDCLVIEASGVAEPARIAAAAEAEPEMTYCGVVTMIDAANIAERLADPRIGAQVAAQVRAADLLLVTKGDVADAAAAEAAVAPLSRAPVIRAPRGAAPVELILDRPAAEGPAAPPRPADHGADYARWSATGGAVPREGLAALLAEPPRGLYRLKGLVALSGGGGAEAQLAGRVWSLAPLDAAPETRVVGIGVAGLFDPAAMEARWCELLAAGRR